MSKYDRIAGEFETIRLTEFWKEYHDRISNKRAADSRACETKEVVARHQGAVEMADFILGRGDYKPLADRILEELTQKGEK